MDALRQSVKAGGKPSGGARGKPRRERARRLKTRGKEGPARSSARKHGAAQEGKLMPGKRVQLDDETWQQLDLLGRDQMKDFQELADEAFRDLLKKQAGRRV